MNRRGAVNAAGGALLWWVCAVAAAGDAVDASVFDLSLESLMELEVSVASPFESNVATTAASVSILRPADWERRGARSLAEALEQIPSVATYASLNSAPMVAVRGYANEISVRGMALQLDGVPLNNFSYSTSAYDLPFLSPDLLGGLEMIRGPGSTLYGSDAFHGVLALSTRRPGVESGRQRLQAGSAGDVVYSAHAGRVLEAGELQGGLALTRHGDRELAYGYRDYRSGAPARGERAYRLEDAAGYLHWTHGQAGDPGGAWRLNLFADEYHSDDFPGTGVQFYPPLRARMALQSLNLAADRDTGDQDSAFRMAGLAYEKRLSPELLLTLNGWRWNARQTWIFDFSAYPHTFPATDGTVPPCRTSQTQANALPVFCPHAVHQGTEEHRTGVKLTLTRDDRRARTQWVLGAGRDRLEVDRAFVRRKGVDGQMYLDIETPFSDVERRIDYAAFQARTLVSDTLSAVYGLRADQYSDVGTAVSPRLGLIYLGGVHWAAKLLYNEAFRAPSAAERFGSGPGSQQMANPDIRPETIRTVELIWQHFRTGQDTEVMIYGSRWLDGIVLNPVTQTVGQYQNTGINEAWGVELGHARRWGFWQFSGNLSHTRSQNLNADKEYSAFPGVIVNLGGGREWAGGQQAWLNLRGLLDQTATDSLAALPVSAAPDYWRLDLHLEHRQPRWRAWLDIRNLLDRDNIVPALYNAEGGHPDEGLSARVGGEWSW